MNSMVFVLGDPMWDIYHIGTLNKIRFTVEQTVRHLGGAANVVANLESLLYRRGVISLFTEDSNIWHKLIRYVVDGEIILEAPGEPINTSVSPTRIYSPFNLFHYETGPDLFQPYSSTTILLISDYNKGMANKYFDRNFLTALKRVHFDYLIVDSRYGTVDPSLLTLGKTKILHCTDKEIDVHNLELYDYTFHTHGIGPVTTFCGPNIFSEHLPPQETPVVDATGAGDTFTASIAAILAKQDVKEIDIGHIDAIAEYAIANCQQVVQTFGTSAARP
jgi:bifunctional ADP-heptose synthase (sugar kinase/adenylyltransferase)